MNSLIIKEDLKEIYGRNINWEQFRGSTILVSGASGMLASYLIYMLIYLNEKKHLNINIIAAIRNSKKFLDILGKYSQSNYISIVTDSILNQININGKIDYIIHSASFASPQYYSVCPVDVLSPNILGTYYLLKLAVEKKSKGFLLFSSGDVYGKITDTNYITEKDMGIIDPLDIHSCYSESKRMAETMCYSFFKQYNVPIKILRIWHTYAPTMDIDKDPRVFASFMKNIVYGQDIEIKSSGAGKRAFCYIADAIAGLFMVLTKGKQGEAYNLCNTEQFVSIRELAETLAKLRSDKNINVILKTRSKNESYTENTAIGEIPPSNEKLKNLGWDPKYDIRTGFGQKGTGVDR